MADASTGNPVNIPILYIIDKMTVGGAQRHLSQVMQRLPSRGFEPWLCCLQETGVMASEVNGERILTLGLRRIYDSKAFATIFSLRRWMRERGFKIAHSYLFSANIFGTIAAKMAGVPVILTSRRDTQFGKTPRQWAALRFSNQISDAVVVNSEDLVGFISRKEHLEMNRIYKIYNGIEPFDVSPEIRQRRRAEFGFGNDDVVLGKLARFRPSKDHETFIRAARLVSERHPNARFLLVGEGETRPAAERLARALGIGDKVVFSGERLDAKEAASAFDIAVFSSLAEGFSNALLELMMLGKPFVATDISGNNEGVREGVNGYLVPVKSPERMALRLGELIQDPVLRGAFGNRSREMVLKDYTLDRMIDSMAGMYFEFLKNKGLLH